MRRGAISGFKRHSRTIVRMLRIAIMMPGRTPAANMAPIEVSAMMRTGSSACWAG